MLQSVEVECKAINNTEYALIHHDSEASATVTGYEAAGSFRYNISVIVSIDASDI